MEKLSLPNVTLLCLTNLDFEGHKRAIDRSCEGVEYGGVKLIWDEKITSIDDWNYKIVYDLHRYVDTDFALLIHADGHVVHPEKWRDEFLEYDFVGAPWPLPHDDYSYRDTNGNIVRVGNSVSLRSKKLMELPSKLGLEFKPYFGTTNEDGKLTCEWRHIMLEHGIKYAPLEVAIHFSKEHEIPENEGLETFAFHQTDL